MNCIVISMYLHQILNLCIYCILFNKLHSYNDIAIFVTTYL